MVGYVRGRAYTVKIRDSALGLSGFVNFFSVCICGGAYPRRIYSYVLWAYLTKPTFLGKAICEGGLSAGGAITNFYSIFNEKSDLNLCPGEMCWVANSNKQTHISLLLHKLSFKWNFKTLQWTSPNQNHPVIIRKVIWGLNSSYFIIQPKLYECACWDNIILPKLYINTYKEHYKLHTSFHDHINLPKLYTNTYKEHYKLHTSLHDLINLPKLYINTFREHYKLHTTLHDHINLPKLYKYTYK